MVKSELSKEVSVICKGSHCVGHSSMHSLYCAVFLPHLIYCSEIYGNTYVNKLTMYYINSGKNYYIDPLYQSKRSYK